MARCIFSSVCLPSMFDSTILENGCWISITSLPMFLFLFRTGVFGSTTDSDSFLVPLQRPTKRRTSPSSCKDEPTVYGKENCVVCLSNLVIHISCIPELLQLRTKPKQHHQEHEELFPLQQWNQHGLKNKFRMRKQLTLNPKRKTNKQQ